MQFLWIPIAKGPEELNFSSEVDIPQDRLQLIDENEAELIRWNEGAQHFERAMLDQEESEEDEEGETQITYSIDHWGPL